jgi:hypothetical protein
MDTTDMMGFIVGLFQQTPKQLTTTNTNDPITPSTMSLLWSSTPPSAHTQVEFKQSASYLEEGWQRWHEFKTKKSSECTMTSFKGGKWDIPDYLLPVLLRYSIGLYLHQKTDQLHCNIVRTTLAPFQIDLDLVDKRGYLDLAQPIIPGQTVQWASDPHQRPSVNHIPIQSNCIASLLLKLVQAFFVSPVSVAISSSCGLVSTGFKSSYTLAFGNTCQTAAVHLQIRGVIAAVLNQILPIVDWAQVLDHHIYHPRSSTRMLYHCKVKRKVCNTCRALQTRGSRGCQCGGCVACLGYCPGGQRSCPWLVDRRPNLPWLFATSSQVHRRTPYIDFALLLSGRSLVQRQNTMCLAWSNWQRCYLTPTNSESKYQLQSSWSYAPLSQLATSRTQQHQRPIDGWSTLVHDDNIELVFSHLQRLCGDQTTSPADGQTTPPRGWFEHGSPRPPKPVEYGWIIALGTRFCCLRRQSSGNGWHHSKKTYLVVTFKGRISLQCASDQCKQIRKQSYNQYSCQLPPTWLVDSLDVTE